MITEIKQKGHNFQNQIKLHDDYVEYWINQDGEKLNTNIKFEEISNTIIEYKTIEKYRAIFGWISIALSGMTILSGVQNIYLIIWFIFGVVSIIDFYRIGMNMISISCDTCNLIFIKNNESNLFIKNLIDARNEKLKIRYAQINWENDLTVELNKFIWLKELNVISENEYSNFKSKLEKT